MYTHGAQRINEKCEPNSVGQKEKKQTFHHKSFEVTLTPMNFFLLLKSNKWLRQQS